MGRGLSEQQKAVVRRTGERLEGNRRYAEKFVADECERQRWMERGVKCEPLVKTAVGRASHGRTRRRLYERGLIKDVYTGGYGRYTGVTLTREGWSLFYRLTGKADGNVNR